ncbi:MAG: glycosyltransferase, partial [Actinomycetota bacterium]
SVEAQARAHAREALAAVERVNQARAWRWGHRLSLLARRLTFRSSVRSRSGLDVAAEQLEGLVATVSESQEAPIPTGREERYVDLAGTVREREATRRAESLKLLASGAQRRGVLRADSVAGKPSVDVIVCVHNAVEYVERCLRSLLGTTTHPFRLVIVDDGSDGETARLLRAVAGGADAIELVERRHPPHGYTRAANAGLGASTADYAVLLNSDTEVTAEWLRTLVETAESDPSLGIVGPLGNAATYQSVPEISRDGKWWNNPMPDWLTPEGVGLAVRTTEGPPAPLAGVLNGFCLCIKRSVIDRIGTFDEEHFGDGYGEENDYCLRATEAGFRLAIATRSFVFHAKSRSYGDDRDDLSKLGGEALRAKHRPSSIEAALASVRDSADLAELRQVTAAALRDPRRLARRLREAGSAPESVAFVLPGLAAGGSGGSHSIVQEARGMANLGIAASIAIPAAAQDRARFAYAEHDDLFVTYDKPADLPHVLDGVQAVIATHHKSVDAVLEVAHASTAVVAYYVQDYEPWFFAPGSAEAREAAASYERMADHVLLAKTYWLGALLASEHGVRVEKVEPSIDSTLFRPAPRPPRGAHARVAAMIRPGTPRRQPSQTLDLLKRLDEEMGGIEAVTFGCEEAELRALTQNERVLAGHRGVLRRREVAEVLRSCDLFVDMSSYQAFGRTAVEAMASGTLAAGPLRGGFAEVAPGDAALHLDTADLEASAIAIADLLGDLQRAEEMRQRGEAVAGLLSVERAALSELVALGKAGAERTAAGAQR